MSAAGPLLLAGGGHSHALILKRWGMDPTRRPARPVVLINRGSTALYSGMVPALIAGIDPPEAAAIDLRSLCDRAGVAFVKAEITGVDPIQRCLALAERPPLRFGVLSLNVGAISRPTAEGMAIKPLEPALALIASEDPHSTIPFTVVGSGAAALEVVLALRRRWPQRPLRLQTRPKGPGPLERRILSEASIALVTTPEAPVGPRLLCTGSRAPHWLAASGLPVDDAGRLHTDAQLRVEGCEHVFASGDCAVITAAVRPASGVWAVRAAIPLAHNLEASCNGLPLRPWHPQRVALQLIGDQQGQAWARRGTRQLGPSEWLWHLKRRIDKRFMAGFRSSEPMSQDKPMACRGCAAKLPAQPLEAALDQAGLSGAPEDAARIEADPPLLQSVDGFPALVSDPWLNGRLTTLHACSDLWACGACVQSAQAVITLPLAPASIQQQLLAQTISGIRSALVPQKAMLIGGHTLEDRNPAPDPCNLGLQLALTVQGSPRRNLWPKRALQAGDQLLLSRPLGTGVLFAAAMTGAARPEDLDTALCQMQTSQHSLVEQLSALEQHHPGHLHAATDITGFGLLGHLGEMLGDTAKDRERLQVQLDANRIPALPGALALLAAGYTSSLAPANRRAWSLLDAPASAKQPAPVGLHLAQQKANHKHHRALLELLIDPQTCGPLLISVTPTFAADLLSQPGHSWHIIGRVSQPMN